MPFTAGDFDRTVGKLRMTRREGKKHQSYWLEHDGKQVLWTMRSQGRGELGRVEFTIRKQLRVNGVQLKALANCPMTREYIAHLIKIGVIPKPDFL